MSAVATGMCGAGPLGYEDCWQSPESTWAGRRCYEEDEGSDRWGCSMRYNSWRLARWSLASQTW